MPVASVKAEHTGASLASKWTRFPGTAEPVRVFVRRALSFSVKAAVVPVTSRTDGDAANRAGMRFTRIEVVPRAGRCAASPG